MPGGKAICFLAVLLSLACHFSAAARHTVKLHGDHGHQAESLATARRLLMSAARHRSPQEIAQCQEMLQSIAKNQSYVTPEREAIRKAAVDRLMAKHKEAGVLEKIEGNSGQIPLQTQLYMNLATIPCVQTICEIGFNAGHSATTWLSARDDTVLISFDLGEHQDYGPHALWLMKEMFPGRLHMILGSSWTSVPLAVKTLGHMCDMLIVDGGHSPDIALEDTRNMHGLARKDFNVFVIDDTNCAGWWCKGPEDSVKYMEERNMLKIMYRMAVDGQGVQVVPPGERGVTFGQYTFHSHENSSHVDSSRHT